MSALLLIDFGAVYWQTYHACQEEVRNTIDSTVKRIEGYAAGHEHVAICCDSERSLRRELYPDYKASREAKPAAAIAGLRETIDRLKADGFVVWISDGAEGDDVIATAVREADNWSGGAAEITIVSGDKDLLQLVNERVRVLSTHTNNLIGPAEVVNKLGVPPHQVAELLALWGDTADNIPGVTGVGPKTAASLLGRYGSIVSIYNALADPAAKHALLTPKLREHLIAERAQVVTALELVTLRTDCEIDFNAIFAPRKIKVLTAGETEGLKRAAAAMERDIAEEEIDVWSPVADESEPDSPAADDGVVVVRERTDVQRGVQQILKTMTAMKMLRTFVSQQLRRGQKDGEGDYGRVPGTNKDTLFLAGAQKIGAFYDVRPVYEVIHRERLEKGHVEYEINCRLVSRATGEEVGSGLGSCSSMEKKYRYRGAEVELTDQKVPKAYWDNNKDPRFIGGKDFVAKKTENGWFIGRKTGEATENPDIADTHNTVLKIAKKRAYVDAMISLGCLTELFTQDIGDTYEIEGVE